MDQRRINGPDGSFSYKTHSNVKCKYPEGHIQDIFDEKGSRKDRNNNESRKIFLKSGVVSQAKGSGYIEQGNTKVLVSVFDPREIPKQNHYCDQGELYCDFKFSPFACSKRKQPQTDAEERSLSLSLKRALLPAVCRHEFPNFQVDVFVNVLEDDGSVLVAAITAAGLALADAGIPMYDVLTASSVLVLNDQILNDPTSAEEDFGRSASHQNLNHGIITMSRLDILEQISELFFSGYVEQNILEQACAMLIKTNKEISQMVKQLLSEKVSKRLKIIRNI